VLYLDTIASKEKDKEDWTYDINKGLFILDNNTYIFAFSLGIRGLNCKLFIFEFIELRMFFNLIFYSTKESKNAR